MTTINDLFPSKYLKAADAEPPMTLTIKHLTKEKMIDMDGNEQEKNVIFFNEVPKGMVLNLTNANVLSDMFGETVEAWSGQKVTLTAQDVTAFGKIQPALRFKRETIKSDPAVQEYWNLCANMRLTREEGLAHLKEFKGDFAKATAGLRGDI